MSRTPVEEPLDRTIAAKVPRPVEDRLRAAARAADRTLSGQVRRVLREWAESASPEDLGAAEARAE
jgi:hypothetical protein